VDLKFTKKENRNMAETFEKGISKLKKKIIRERNE